MGELDERAIGGTLDESGIDFPGWEKEMTKRLGKYSFDLDPEHAKLSSLVSARLRLWDINGFLGSRFASWLKIRSRRTESLMLGEVAIRHPH